MRESCMQPACRTHDSKMKTRSIQVDVFREEERAFREALHPGEELRCSLRNCPHSCGPFFEEGRPTGLD